MSKTATEEQAQEASADELGSELLRIQEHSIDSRRVEGEIRGFEHKDDTIVIEIERLTTGESVTEELDKPEPWSNSYKFVRLMEYCGYDTGGTDQLVGHQVPLIPDDDDDEWVMDIDRNPGEAAVYNRKYFDGLVRGGAVGLSALLIQPIAAEVLPYLGAVPDPWAYRLVMGVLGFIWMCLIIDQFRHGMKPAEDDDRVTYPDFTLE